MYDVKRSNPFHITCFFCGSGPDDPLRGFLKCCHWTAWRVTYLFDNNGAAGRTGSKPIGCKFL